MRLGFVFGYVRCFVLCLHRIFDCGAPVPVDCKHARVHELHQGLANGDKRANVNNMITYYV